jgi:hypothetical protein
MAATDRPTVFKFVSRRLLSDDKKRASPLSISSWSGIDYNGFHPYL